MLRLQVNRWKLDFPNEVEKAALFVSGLCRAHGRQASQGDARRLVCRNAFPLVSRALVLRETLLLCLSRLESLSAISMEQEEEVNGLV